ncbi:hypothetical protein B0H13DRAFT_2236323 [Mycena leptocephala]|nr:hypothetical protein B0H13DRAFT_2236323 [Mycena leptocephala]
MATQTRAPVWWPMLIFMTFIHIFTVWATIYWCPIHAVSTYSLVLSVLLWRITGYGKRTPNISKIGYHRFYSHRAFRATFAVRVIIAALGMAASQGSIKVYIATLYTPTWSLRRKQKFTDDPVHDPYAATRGLFYSHIGWLFYKPVHERISLADREDLDSDPVVRLQHKCPVIGSIFLGFIVPALLGLCANTSRGNLLLAVITAGEGSHNFVTQVTFPHDWRSDPHPWSWDPSKWVIFIFYRLGLVSQPRTANEADLKEATEYMRLRATPGGAPTEQDVPWTGDTWDITQAIEYVASRAGCCVMIIDEYLVDVTLCLGEHPAGARILRKYALAARQDVVPSASWAFNGDSSSNHSRSARRRMRMLRIAHLRSEGE